MTDAYVLDRCIDTIQTKAAGTVHVETGGIDHRETDVPIQIDCEHSRRGSVHLSVGKAMPGATTEASATCYLSPRKSEDLAASLRGGTQIRLFSDDANVWVEKGWCYTEGVADDDTTKGEVEYTNGSLSVVTTVEGRMSGGVLGAVALDQAEREWLADSLETEAAIAREQEPIEVGAGEEQTAPRWKPLAKHVGSLGIGVGIAGFVFYEMVAELSAQTLTFSQATTTTLAVPFALVVVMSLLVFGMNRGDGLGGGL